MTVSAAAPPAPVQRVGRRRARKLILNLAYVAAILISWEVLVRALNIGKLLLPPPSAVAGQAAKFAGLLASSSAVTLTEAAVGFLFAVVVGIGLALLITYSTGIGSVIMTTLVGINATPKVAVAPILVIWLGLGIESKIALAFLLAFFPIVVNSVRGFADVPVDLLNLYRLIHATPLQVFRKVRLPSALPSIFDGFKIALPVSLIGAVAGEFVAARQGVGYQIVLAYANFNSALVFASVITIAVLATILFQILVVVEDRVLFWRPSKQRF
jgi:NitT/TauT family transport system permease protein